MARHGIAFRGSISEVDGNFSQLLVLISTYCPRLKHWLDYKDKRPYKVTYISPKSQNEFPSLLGDEIRTKTKDEIKP